jgi:hypothetical protein
MVTKDVDIRVNSKADLKGFKQADTAITKLNKNTKSLAKNFGLAFGTAAVVAFGKASVKAFAADEAAARRLSTAVENLGIGFANPQITNYIANLEKSAAIADDVLRPAFQSLLTTTGSLTKSQELLNNAIQISRASGVDLATVADDLARGYVGNTRSLAKYNSGLTRAELQSKSFAEILGVLLARSAGAAEDYLKTTSYQMEVLSIATGNASEIIGGGLVDAFARIGGGTEASDAATAIETIATAIAKLTVATGATLGAIPNLLKNLKNLPKQIFFGFAGKQAGVNLAAPKKEENKLTATQLQQQQALAKLQAAATKREKELLALKNKQNVAAKLKLAIDKANLALGKGSNVFDMDAIQLNAALINQAQQLGNATNAAQILAISNDIARLNVKKSMYELEKAIESGDVIAIENATKKLNADLQILGALTGQKNTLATIKTILDSLLPKDLINLQNLRDAIALLNQISGAKAAGAGAAAPFTPTTESVAKAIADRAPYAISGPSDPRVTYGGQRPNMGGGFDSYDPERAAAFSFAAGRAAATSVNITVNAGVGDPNAIAEAVNQVLQDAIDRGTLRTV